MSLLFITHNLSIVKKLADSVAVMQNGRCVEQNSASTLLARTAPYTQRLLDSEPPATRFRSADSTPLLRVEDLSVSFPIRKGILRRVVDQNPVLKNIRFRCAGRIAGAGGRIRFGQKHHRSGAAALNRLPGRDPL
jgi:microcin C transport system ATP-binding protein